MNARAGRYQGIRDPRGGRHDDCDRAETRRHVRALAHRETRELLRTVRLQGISALRDA